HLRVQTADGPVSVARSAIARAKRVPEKRALTATEAVERVAAAGWPAPATADPGDWLLRAADGWTNRGNSALAVGDPGRPLAEAAAAGAAGCHAATASTASASGARRGTRLDSTQASITPPSSS